MIFNFTGIIYSFGALMFGILTFRFYNHWMIRKTIIYKDFFYLGLSFSVFSLITALGCFFFAETPQILKWVVVISTFLQSLAMAFLGHLIFYLKFPKYSPWVGFFIIFIIGLATTLLTAFQSFEPILVDNVIDWNYSFTNIALRIMTVILVLVPAAFIFFQKGVTSTDARIKARTLIFNLVFLIGFLSATFAFFLKDKLRLAEDVSMLFVYLAAVMLILTAQKRESSYVKEL